MSNSAFDFVNDLPNNDSDKLQLDSFFVDDLTFDEEDFDFDNNNINLSNQDYYVSLFDSQTSTSSNENNTIKKTVSEKRVPKLRSTKSKQQTPQIPSPQSLTHIPLRNSVQFCPILSGAINQGDPKLVADLVRSITHPQVVFCLKNDFGGFQCRGQQGLIEYLSKLMNDFPDLVFLLKKTKLSTCKGLRIVRSKIIFTGTKAVPDKSKKVPEGSLPPLKLRKASMKGVSTSYLDKDNRSVLITQEFQLVKLKHDFLS